MQLKSVHITNYRNIMDSGKFDIGQLTCLVGKNESGKSSVLKAMEGMNPLIGSPGAYSSLDFPRSKWDGDDMVAKVVTTEWILDDADIAAVEKALCPGCVGKDRMVEVSGFYGKKREWNIPIDEKMLVGHFLSGANLSESDVSALKSCVTTQDLHNKAKSLAGQSPQYAALVENIESKKYRGNSATFHAIDALIPRMPKFLYFSEYSSMSGEVSLEKLEGELANQPEGKPSPGDRVFHEFIQFANLSLDKIKNATQYTKLAAMMEAASNRVSVRIFRYWSQNKHLSVKVTLASGKPDDAPPFNKGTVIRAEVHNTLHHATVNFAERSTGFVWFFSFLVHFARMHKEHGGNLIILLDEPGHGLHGKAQGDLLRYIEEELKPKHQVIYTTHSPFMLPVHDWSSIRTVEDNPDTNKAGEPVGAKVSKDILTKTPDTVFPLQGALGYDIAQYFLIGANVLLVEGDSDVRYLHAVSSHLRKKKKGGLSDGWTICPVGGISKISPFVSLFGGNELRVAALSDCSNSRKDKKTVEDLRENSGLCGMHTYAEFSGKDKGEADVEDLFDAEIFARMVNGAFDLRGSDKISADNISDASKRMVERVDARFRLMSSTALENFNDHYRPAEWLAENLEILDEECAAETLNRFEKIFQAYNKVLKKAKGEGS